MALEMGGIAGAGGSSQQAVGQLAGLEKMAGSAAGMLSPTGMVVDTLGSALGLPDPIKNIAKIAVGMWTGDMSGVVSGALGLAGDVMEELAKTQYQPPADPAQAGQGYAAEEVCCGPAPRPPLSCGPASLEDRMLDRLGGAQREVEGLMEKALANPNDKRTQLELQRAQERMRALFEMLSGLFKMNHEMRMAAIQNAR